MTESTKPDGTPVDDIQRLRDIILGEEKDRLHALDQRITDLESRTADVAEVLPAAMHRLVVDPISQSEFARPVVSTIRTAARRDTESFAEALFPVLGPAIRRAVADALKGLVQRINAALEHSFTIKGLKWRLEAARTGVPFAQIVLRHTMLYTVQEVFLIQRGSGLILASVQRDQLLALDEDAVAAMLTAIQSFIQDSFGISSDEPLRSAELGERTVWVINGPAAVLACVITGAPPLSLRDELMGLLETLHARFGGEFSDNPDGLASHEGLQAQLEDALREEADESTPSTGSSRAKVLWFAAGAVLLLLILLMAIDTWRDRQFARQVVGLFSAEPGYVITAAKMRDGLLNVSGLRDPESVQPAALLDSQHISPAKVKTDFRPYESLDSPVVISRLRRRFGLDGSTGLSLQDNMLTVSGTLTHRQMVDLKALPEYHTLIRRLNLDGVRLNAEEASTMFREALHAPDSVSFRPTGTEMAVSGSDEWAWYITARDANIEAPGWQLDFLPLENALSAQLDDAIQSLNGRVFQYSNGTLLTAQSDSSLDSAAAELVRAQGLANALGVGLDVVLEGSGDGTGSPEQNLDISMKRSRHLFHELVARGMTEHNVTQTQAPWQEGGNDPERRKVTLWLERGKP